MRSRHHNSAAARVGIVVLLTAAMVGQALPTRADTIEAPDTLDQWTTPDADSAGPQYAYGYWRTDRGPMTLFVLYPSGYGHGSYPWFDGSLIGQVHADRSIVGHWYQNDEGILCGDDGSERDFESMFAFKPDGPDRFVGKLWYCGDTPDSPVARWNGVLIAGRAWFDLETWIGPYVRRPELDVGEKQGRTVMKRMHGDTFDPTTAQSYAFDMTCDGGLDRVYVWRGPADDPTFRLSVVHEERQLFEGEDTSGVETIVLGGGGAEQPGRCPIEAASDMVEMDIDLALLRSVAPTLAPTCTRIIVGPGQLCRVYWDLKTGTLEFF